MIFSPPQSQRQSHRRRSFKHEQAAEGLADQVDG
jgi:hypothetical protein